jgi:hypothetical protein
MHLNNFSIDMISSLRRIQSSTVTQFITILIVINALLNTQMEPFMVCIIRGLINSKVLKWTSFSPHNYSLWIIPDLVTPVAEHLWTVTGSNAIKAIAISPDGTLYGGRTDGYVYQLNWDTGALEGVIAGYPAFSGGMVAYPSVWFTFDLTGETLYLPSAIFNVSVITYVAACYLPSGEVNFTMQASSDFYPLLWYNQKEVVFYGNRFSFRKLTKKTESSLQELQQCQPL